MDFINQAKQLADTVKDKVQELSNNVADSIDNAIAQVKTAATEITASAVATVNDSTTTIQPVEVLQKAGKSLNDAAAVAVGFTTSSVAIADALKNLPRTAQELAIEMPKIANKLKHRAGLRVGDTPRSNADVMKLFEKIPGTSKLGASETNIRQFLADKHGSHVIPRSKGGTNAADNILWEIGTDNISRGAKIMTPSEQVYIRVYNAVDSIVKNSTTIAKLGVAATGTAILTQAVVTAISYSLDLYRGDITIEEYKNLIIQEVVRTGIATPIFFLIFIAVLALFPEITFLLSAPAVVAGFNALFGISIALPIVQSVIRHVEAGGFGEEIADSYQNLIAGT